MNPNDSPHSEHTDMDDIRHFAHTQRTKETLERSPALYAAWLYLSYLCDTHFGRALVNQVEAIQLMLTGIVAIENLLVRESR